MKYIDVYRMRKKADWYNPLTWFNEEPQQEAIDKAREKLRIDPGSLTQEEAALLEKAFGQGSSDNDFQRAALDKAWETFQKDPSKLSQEDLRMLQDAGYESKQYYPYGQSPIEKQLRRRREGAGTVFQQPYYTQMKRAPYTPDILPNGKPLPKKTPAQVRAQLAQIRAKQQQRRDANYGMAQGESVKPQTPEERAERYARLRRTQRDIDRLNAEPWRRNQPEVVQAIERFRDAFSVQNKLNRPLVPQSDKPQQAAKEPPAVNSVFTMTPTEPTEQEIAANERYQQQLQAWRELQRDKPMVIGSQFDPNEDYVSKLSDRQKQAQQREQAELLARNAEFQEKHNPTAGETPQTAGQLAQTSQLPKPPPPSQKPQYAQYTTPEKGTINGDAATIARMKQQDAAKPGITYVDPKTKKEVAVAAPQKPKWNPPQGKTEKDGKWVQVDPGGARVWVKNGQTFNQNYNPEVAGVHGYTQPRQPQAPVSVPAPAQTRALVAAGNETMPRRPMTPYQAQQDLMRRNRERRPQRV